MGKVVVAVEEKVIPDSVGDGSLRVGVVVLEGLVGVGSVGVLNGGLVVDSRGETKDARCGVG